MWHSSSIARPRLVEGGMLNSKEWFSLIKEFFNCLHTEHICINKHKPIKFLKFIFYHFNDREPSETAHRLMHEIIPITWIIIRLFNISILFNIHNSDIIWGVINITICEDKKMFFVIREKLCIKSFIILLQEIQILSCTNKSNRNLH